MPIAIPKKTVIQMPSSSAFRGSIGAEPGVEVCCGWRVCTCFNICFLTTQHGLLKLFEVLLGSLCQTLLVKYGMSAAKELGEAYHGFLTTVSACLLTSGILLCCYIISTRTFHLVRQSLFEILFNGLACFLYLSAASYMTLYTKLWHAKAMIFLADTQTAPAIAAVNYIGVVVGLVYGFDCILAYKTFRGYV